MIIYELENSWNPQFCHIYRLKLMLVLVQIISFRLQAYKPTKKQEEEQEKKKSMMRRSRRKKGKHQQVQHQLAVDRISELPDSLISKILSLLDMKDAVKTSVLSKRWKCSWIYVVDRLSELPDSLIGHILSFLDMNDAVKTSVLSKRWRYSWTHVVDRDVFVFDCGSLRDTEPSAEIFEQFLLFVDRILKQCTCPKIKKFSLTGTVLLTKFSIPVDKLVDKWFDVLLAKEVEVLKLGLLGLVCDFPARFYSSSSLVRLEIDGVGKHYGDLYLGVFPSIVSLEFNYGYYHYEKTFDVCWNNLKSLSLEVVSVEDRFLVEILLACPMLETLVLDTVVGLREINIQSPSVCELKLLNLFSVYSAHCMEITAPWIKKLEVSGSFDCTDFNLVCASSLKSANLTLSYDRVYDHLNENNHKDGFVSANLIDKLLEPVCDVDDLVIGAELLQALSVSQLTSKHSPVFMCKYLAIHSPISVHEVPGIACLLESSPNLETLVVRVMQQCCITNKVYDYKYNTYIKELFTSFDGVDYLGRQKQKLLCLKNIKIDCREKSYSCDQDQSSDNKCFELEIAAYIIRQAPFLEKLVILSSTSNCFSCGALYFSVMSSKRKVGEKASRWELKKTDTTYEFIFSP